MGFCRDIIPFYGRTIQVSEILFNLPRNMLCCWLLHKKPGGAKCQSTGVGTVVLRHGMLLVSLTLFGTKANPGNL